MAVQRSLGGNGYACSRDIRLRRGGDGESKREAVEVRSKRSSETTGCETLSSSKDFGSYSGVWGTTAGFWAVVWNCLTHILRESFWQPLADWKCNTAWSGGTIGDYLKYDGYRWCSPEGSWEGWRKFLDSEYILEEQPIRYCYGLLWIYNANGLSVTSKRKRGVKKTSSLLI